MEELIAKSLEDGEQLMSEIELDPSEVPCFYESDDHHEQEIREEKSLKEEMVKMEMYELEEGWQVVVPKPPIPDGRRRNTRSMTFCHIGKAKRKERQNQLAKKINAASSEINVRRARSFGRIIQLLSIFSFLNFVDQPHTVHQNQIGND